MIELEKYERFRQQYQSELEAAEAELQALLPDGETKKVIAAQAKVSALAQKLVAQTTQVEQLRDQLDAERVQSARMAKLRALKKLADGCTKLEVEKAAAAEQAEEALAAFTSVALRVSEAQDGLRERFAVEAGDQIADLTEALSKNGTDTAAITGNTPDRGTPFAHALRVAIAPLATARYWEKQEAERAAREERLAQHRAQLEAGREESRRAEVEEEQREALEREQGEALEGEGVRPGKLGCSVYKASKPHLVGT